MKPRVLIITYYWPPSGGGGVQRWLKFAKYLPENGYVPVIYTPENADYPVLDESLHAEVPAEAIVLRQPIWEPYRTFRKVSSEGDKSVSAGFIRSGKKESIKTRMAQWLRGNLIIPDARRFWIEPSFRYLTRYLRETPVDVIVSTGPPHSMHLIALKVSKSTGIPWLADFRDPWVNMDNADKFRMTRLAWQVHERMERNVLSAADAVVTVSWHLSAQYEKLRGREVLTITNGYDHTDFAGVESVDTSEFIIGHYGTFGEDRNPIALWDVLDELTQERADFEQALRVQLIGPTDVTVLEAARSKHFGAQVNHIPYLSHDAIIKQMSMTSLLLVILNQNANEEGRVTGKIFEYVASRKPVLGLVSVTSDCARVIQDTKCGEMIAFNDKARIRSFILDAYEKRLSFTAADSAVRYSRQSLTRDLALTLDRLRESRSVKRNI
jgi:glycosyltransferase involved in cell wall biosynthesis